MCYWWKVVNSIRKINITIFITFGIFVAFLFNYGFFSVRLAKAIVSFLSFIFFFIEFFCACALKEIVAKGVVIKKDQYPSLFSVILVFLVLLCLLSFVGMFCYTFGSLS